MNVADVESRIAIQPSATFQKEVPQAADGDARLRRRGLHVHFTLETLWI